VVLDRIRGLLKGKGPEKPDKGAEKPMPQSAAEFALSDIKSGLLGGSYTIVIWEKACDDPGMKPDLQDVVAVVDGGSVAYVGVVEKNKIVSVQITSSEAPGIATTYIITRSFLNEFLKQIDKSILKKLLKIKPEEVAMIYVASPETLGRHYNVKFDTCVALPIPRRSAEKHINTIISEIEKRIKRFAEATKQSQSDSQTQTAI
jgi:hypothetical protein